jgi:hypothetical protein
MALNEVESFDSAAQAKRNLPAAIEKVSARLGNTTTICRKCYVHPEVLNSYMDDLVLELKSKAESELRSNMGSLKPEEAAVLALLRDRLSKEAEGSRSTRGLIIPALMLSRVTRRPSKTLGAVFDRLHRDLGAFPPDGASAGVRRIGGLAAVAK